MVDTVLQFLNVNTPKMSVHSCILKVSPLDKLTVNSCAIVDLGGLVVSVLATGPKVRGFDPDRAPLPSEGK
jgi:hypothetical protein